MPSLPLVGTDFASYRLQSVLGRGGMSIVYQAENPRLHNVVALKVLDPALAGDEVFRTRFREESQIAASLNHANVIPIHDFGSSGGLLYIVMRYVPGTDLRQLLAERGWLPPYTALYLLGQAARALDAAHRRGLVHRDVKPGNLLVARSGSGDVMDPEHVYLADFGITKYVGRQSGLTAAGMMIGTLHYSSPEQIQGQAVLGTADQYSLGCVLYECLTGRAPFEKGSNEAIMWAHVNERPAPPTLLRPDLPPAIDEVLARVLAKDPGDRYANCREFIAAASGAIATPGARSPGSASPAGTPGLARTPGFGAPAAGTPASGAPAAAAPGEFWAAPVPPERFPVPAAPTVREPRAATVGAASPSGAPGAEAGWQPLPAADGNGRPVRRRPVRRRPAFRRRREFPAARPVLSLGAIAIAAAVIAAGGTAAGMLLRQTGNVTTASHQATRSPAPASTLTAVLDRTQELTRMVPMSACVQKTPALDQCTKPNQVIASVTFATYPSLAALYANYQEIVSNLTGGKPFTAAENMRACGATAPDPTAESTWNNSDQYFTTYSADQLASGTIPAATAMGRVFCVQQPNGSTVILWTQNSGKLLGYATSGDVPYGQVWQWFTAVHTNITFPSQPGTTGGSKLPRGTTPGTSVSVSPLQGETP